MLLARASALRLVSGLVGLFDWATKPVENREEPRLSVNFQVSLSASGPTLPVRGIDVNRKGLGVIAKKPLGLGSQVFVRLEEVGLMGFAYVRHCGARGEEGHHIGLEFRDSLVRLEIGDGHWERERPKPSAVWDEPAW